MKTYRDNFPWQEKLSTARGAWRNGDFIKAQNYYEEAIALIEHYIGRDNIEVCIPLMDLAECTKSAGDNSQAEQLYSRATYVLASYAKNKLHRALNKEGKVLLPRT
jgi:Tfp pilus assembly protein PilF